MAKQLKSVIKLYKEVVSLNNYISTPINGTEFDLGLLLDKGFLLSAQIPKKVTNIALDAQQKQIESFRK